MTTTEAEYRLYSIGQDVEWLVERLDRVVYSLRPEELIECAKQLNELATKVLSRQRLRDQLKASLALDTEHAA